MSDDSHSASQHNDTEVDGGRPRFRSSGLAKLLVLVAVACVIGLVYSQFAETLSLTGLSAQESALQQYKQQHPVGVYAVAFLIYTTVTGLSLPLAAPLTVAYGWFFGFVPGVILVSLASTSGSTIAFLLSRYLFRDTFQRKFGDRLERFNAALEREGAFYLFTLRVIPAVPFFIINVVMGLTPIRVFTFWWVSQVGMFAGTCVFVYAGSAIPSAQQLAQTGLGGILTPQIFLAFVLLGLFPIVVKKLMARIRPATADNSH